MSWPAFRFFACLVMMAVPFLTPCARPAQPSPEDKSAIEKLAAHLRIKEGLDDHHSNGEWLVQHAGAAASGRNYRHDPILQIGGITDTVDQDRIIAEIGAWQDKSRFSAVMVHFYGAPKDAAEPSSALTNLIRSQRVDLKGSAN
jgi:hypothetical protein